MNVAGCTTIVSVSRIRCEENGRKIIIVNDKRDSYHVTKFDGCVVKDSRAADWVIDNREGKYVVVELKGKNVDYAVDQAISTIEHLKKVQSDIVSFSVVIVSTGYPRIDTKIQIAKNLLSKRYRSPLHVVRHAAEVQFSDVFSYKRVGS